ncbi:MAG: LptE family protein [Candidatus Omnitrophica bacterium]|jgi:hypothetical protein|nr:LptE family protein [Candidatus Omnitrophota bacterium]
MKNKSENYACRPARQGLLSNRQSHKVHFFFLFAICCLLATALPGCGYTTRSMLYGKYSTIYITPFLNKVDVIQESYTANKYRIYRPMLETDITKKVINRYLFDGNLKPVKEDEADLVLKGELIEYRKDPLSYTSDSEDVTEYRINIYVNLKLWDKKENKIMWEENNFNGNYSYFVKNSTINPGNNVVVVSEGAAVNSAVEDLARRIVERTVEQW